MTGSTRRLYSRSIPHSNQDLAPFPTLNDQLDYRVALVRGLAGPGAGGPVHPAPPWWAGAASCPNIVAGGYQVDDALVDCLLHYPVFEHASNLGGRDGPGLRPAPGHPRLHL